jgi:tetratricopeptide (TPR) repeat protein/DNA-binding winged helix-turn-helix (wHTH) protein
MKADLLQGFYLGDRLVEPLRGRVTGRSGSAHLPPKAVGVLLNLAARPGELVTRETLLHEVWGSDRGSHEALGHAMSDIRHALEDRRENPEFVQTLPKRGYRLLVEPTLRDRAAATHTPAVTGPTGWHALLRRGVIQAAAAYLVVGWLLIQIADATFTEIGLPSWSEQFITFVVIGGFPLLILLTWFLEFVQGRIERDQGQQRGGLFQGLERNYLAIFIAYGLSALGVGVYQATVGFKMAQPPQAVAVDATETDLLPVLENSVAVLQFATFNDDMKTKAFSAGLSEDILDGLASLPGLYVSARGDSWSLPPNAPSAVVRHRLRVASYIEGSVRFLGDKLRVVVQLIDSKSGFHLFSRSFDIDIGEIGSMQREVTKLVVANLKLAIDETVIESAIYHSDTPDSDAYILYQLGRQAANRPRSPSNLQEAIDYFQQALTIDDQYPAAHAGLCGAYTSLYDLREDATSIELAEAACSRAMAVAPRLPLVLNTFARLLRRTGQYGEADAMYQNAMQINEQDAVAMQGLALIRRRQQQFDEAEHLMRRAIELQPGNWVAINTLGNMYFRMGRYTDAIDEYRKVVYLDPTNFVTLGNLGSARLMTGDFDAARDDLLRSIELEEDGTFLANLGIAHYYLGDFAEAVAALQRAVELAPQSAGSWLALGDALQFSDDRASASSAYETALGLSRKQVAINGKDVDSLTWLAWATAMTGDLDEAAAIARRAIEVDPAYPYAHYYHALVNLQRGDRAAAIDAAESAIENGYSVAMLAAEPILDNLHDDSRFVRLLAKHSIGGRE